MRTQLEETVLEYVGELDRAPTPARAMKRAAARVRDRDALLAERRDAKRAEIAALSNSTLHERAKRHALPVSPWRSELIETLVAHEVGNALTAEWAARDLAATADTEPPPAPEAA